MSSLADKEDELADRIRSFRHDPYGYVLYAFPWGEPNTDLEDKEGPREWQREVLEEIGEKLAANELGAYEAIQEAIASGHGIGKSALVAWLIKWALDTEPETKGVVTANTENQLKTKTWAELAKWHRLSITSHWFTYTATSIYCSDAAYEKTWRVDMIPWSERNTEAFAGLHNEGKRILLIFDEASAIPDLIWEVSEGALTDEDTEIIWAVFGNPTRNNGRFAECFGKLRHRWSTRQIDSRDVPGTNKAQIRIWVEDYGEDSDFVRVRVRGVFPRAGNQQFIPVDIVEAAMARDLEPRSWHHYPKVIGVDVARFGSDQSVIIRRQGTKAFEPKTYRQIDTMELAAMVVEDFREWHASVIVVDETGLGGGVVDRLTQLGLPVMGVNFGSTATDPTTYTNMRAQIWGDMKIWLNQEVDIPNLSDLRDDLVGVEYGYDSKMRIQLERKDRMRERGLSSPDIGDALALTFADYSTAMSAMHKGSPTRRQVQPVSFGSF